MESALAARLSKVSKVFHGDPAVRDLDLDIPTGSIVGIVGPSGSGKTTTIRMITGSLMPTSGSIHLFGQRASGITRADRSRIGYMPQQFSLYPDLSVSENVDFVASIYGLILFRRWRRKRIVLELVDLWSVRSRRAGQLSGGMQRRLELAATLVHEPDLLVLDEPTAGVDPLLRKTVWEELQRQRQRGVTSVVTTQYVTEAEHCDRVALISDGRLIASGAPDDLRRAAFGGDVVEITTERVFDATTLSGTAGIRQVDQTGPRDARLIVDDAGASTADIVEAVTGAGGGVASVREVRPTFEEVFTALVERDRAAQSDADANVAA